MAALRRRKDISKKLSTLSPSQKQELFEYMDSFLESPRRERLNGVLENRTTHFCVAMEDLFYERNSGAIIRTADGYGIQNVHVIEPKESFKSKVTNIISKGAEKWVTKTQHDDIKDGAKMCIAELRAQGYQIVATSPHTDGHTIHNFDISKKSAFFLGAEKTGISDIVMEEADDYISMPIYGFTESYNVSVANAILLHELVNRLRSSEVNWKLSDTERKELLLDWTMKSVVSSDFIAEQFIHEKGWE
ncbi:MAG: tRNA (guanosine-2'-O-)-methyltransferase, partial [Salibacteraceae bacterium]